jgi:glycosyltransferase involved in cell wall biosynthesis
MHFSIIIPTVNRCDLLRDVLQSLSEIEHEPSDHEIIVVDNSSTDGTRMLVEQAAASCPTRDIRHFHEPVPGLLSGRHRGALEAKGDICVFLDDDVRVGRDWLMALKDAFGDPDTTLVGGPSSPLFDTHPPDWLANFYEENDQGRYCGWLSLFDGGLRNKEIDPCYVWGLNFAIRRKVLVDVGGFHPDYVPKCLQRYQGDGETGLSLKLKMAGLKALYHPSASVQHVIPASRLTVEYFEQRAFYQGVADSFTRIRTERRATRAKHSWKGALRRIKRFVGDVTGDERVIREIVQRRTAEALTAGYDFHQLKVRRDPLLLKWVLRKDYWDYQLPEGWEKYWMRETIERSSG